MPLFTLSLTATTEGCTLSIADPATFPLRVKFQCISCREEAPKYAVLSLGDGKQEIPGGRGEATYVAKCSACKAVGSADLLSVLGAALGGEGGSAAPVPVAKLECRGLEPVAWQAGDGWRVASTASAATWEASFMEEAEFTEYDEESAASVEASGVAGVWSK